MKVRRWLVVIVACLSIAGGLSYFKYQQIQSGIAFAAAFPEPVEAVELFIAREELWQPTTLVTAEVVAIRNVELSNELAGRIVEVGFGPGATVAAGQLLIRLDTSEERAQLAAARAQAELARLALQRNEKLIQSGAAAEEARDRTRAEYDAARAEVSRLTVIIDKQTLRSPFDAQAGLHELEVGQFLDRGTVITRLIGIDVDIWIDFTLPQQTASLAIEAAVIVDPANALPFEARVIARDAFVDKNSRNVHFRAIASNTVGLYAGTMVTVEVPLGAPRVATLVPVTAVRRDAFGANIYVLRPAEEGARAAERAERRSVELGPHRGDLLVVTSGLIPGERVAANGAFKLRDGALVDAKQSTVPRSE
ncbi:MAG: efflux RND transporter periplasmic adaptor subunit [Pseudomonadales bacterium]